MAISVTHPFVSAKLDDADATLVRPSNWNAAHTITMATNKLMGRATAATGAVEEISLGTSLSFAGTTLNAVQSVSAASRLLGRGSASGAGAAEEITLGAGLSMTGTTLAATAATATTTAPQGRLTLATATPVMTTTQAAKTTLYYTPAVGGMVPIYDGSSMVMTAFTELSVATSDTTKSPAAIGASKVNDWFVWSDAGTLRLGHGPDWTNDTTRSAGTALTMVNGILLNNVSITNGPAASRGTYVGTTRSNASSQLDWQFGAFAASATPGLFGVWNCYNRRRISTLTGSSTANWTQTNGVWQGPGGGTTMYIGFVSGLSEDAATGTYLAISTIAGGQNAAASVGVDVFNSPHTASLATASSNTATSALTGVYSGTLAIGWHFLAAIEYASGATVTWYGQPATGYKTGLHSSFFA